MRDGIFTQQSEHGYQRHEDKVHHIEHEHEGGALVRALQAPPQGQVWTRLSVWTRSDNRRALRLYDSCGFVDTGERASLHEGDQITRLEWRRPT